MNQETSTAVDRYTTDTFVPADLALDQALEANSGAGLPAHDVAPNQGKLLHLLALLRGAVSILEIGTFGGYSTVWLARALPPAGRVVTLEADPVHADVALKLIAQAGLSDRVALHLGPATGSLARLKAQGAGPFDFIIIDADKPNSPANLEWAMRLSRPGTLIIGYNVVRGGAILDSINEDSRVKEVQTFFAMMAAEPRLLATAPQTVGIKGYDGFTMALVTS